MTILALVTGGNRGLGLATARALAEHGTHVIIGARQDDAGRRAAEELRASGLLAEHVVLDVDDPASVQAAAHQVGCRHGRLDVLVNNAGILPEATASATEVVDAALFRRTFETNLFGAVSVIEAFLPLLRVPDRATRSSTCRRPWARWPTRPTPRRPTTTRWSRPTRHRRPP